MSAKRIDDVRCFDRIVYSTFLGMRGYIEDCM